MLDRIGRIIYKNQEYDMHVVQRVYAAVDLALRVQFTPSQCLYRSCVAHFMLFFRGIVTKFRIGIKPLPFYAHAWLELNGKPIVDEDTKDLHILL